MRRLVTGVDDQGRSRVVENEELTTGTDAPAAQHVFRTPSKPPPARPQGTGAFRDLGVPPGILQVYLVHMPPNAEHANHHTDTVDVDTILGGGGEIVLDDGAHTLAPGDCVVVNGVDHAWRAGPDGLTFTAVVLGTPPPLEP
ncbi:MAG: hypothetical protein JO337_12290 [Acidimicrobiales bacterium]|nr:hypothetical protein [Acidimicrobiales bacterium]